MSSARDSFIVWLDHAVREGGELEGTVEFTARSERMKFRSARDLVGFMERCVGRTPGGLRGAVTPHHDHEREPKRRRPTRP